MRVGEIDQVDLAVGAPDSQLLPIGSVGDGVRFPTNLRVEHLLAGCFVPDDHLAGIPAVTNFAPSGRIERP